MTITLRESLDLWLKAAEARLADVVLAPPPDQIGVVEQAGDGIAFVRGLPDLPLGALMRFESGASGFAHALDEDLIGCVLLDFDPVKAGEQVRGLGGVVTTPVGEALLGRIVDPLGRPLDEHGPIAAVRYDPVERAAPGIIERDLVTQPLQTGIKLVDALFALGRGQRELIIGDRETGKTAIAVDAIINQRNSDVICIYVAVGQKSSTVRQVIDAVAAHGDPQRCIFVVAGPSTAPGLQWLAPYAGFAMAEYFRDQGGHALVVVDDLSKHAATHRELSLLMRQPSGREAYPGDVFHIHARLLERAAKLSAALGGGTLTALPIAQTEAGNLSAYIPTNLISITDGQIVLSAKLFGEGQKPAVDIGLSVSRVGGKTQAPVLRELAETLRLDYAQFLELELFTRFSTTLDPRTQAQIEHGRRIRAVLTQAQYAPLSLAHEAAELLALHDGLLDGLPLDRIEAFKHQLPAWLEQSCKGVLDRIEAERTLDPSDRDRLRAAIEDLVKTLTPSASQASA
ncbi:F0F1 ATP synthase subunit alpha [Phenylobacterium montanum]|uniref:ATP synthase subunit alpha n=1 Tax=Phenylobacterium montanum TaxID=2823693 RepID=A0A975G1S8_9CAUL|nr:F0F1 ATP synthase subunit alpha [Caulobacter sp. S6]QUD89540.1 F0F1 ATP synthase subunit alpha [Caulobacter sp. S6]